MIEFISSIFIMGGVMWWILLLGCLIVTTATIERHAAPAIWCVVIYVLATTFLGDGNLFSFIKHNPLTFIQYILMYLVIGLVWAICKWSMRLRDFKKKYMLEKNDFLRNNSEDEWLDRISTASKRTYNDLSIPTWHGNKDRIATWMAFWPTSFVATFIGDLLYRFYDSLCAIFRGVFERLREICLGEVLEDQKKANEKQ